MTFGQRIHAERDIQKVIEEKFAPEEQYGAFQWQVTSQTLLGDRTINRYGVAPADIQITPWEYVNSRVSYASEELMLDALLAQSDIACPAPTYDAFEWKQTPGDTSDPEHATGGSATINYTYYEIYGSNAACAPRNSRAYATRKRTVQCPDPFMMEWSAEQGACVDNEALGSAADFLLTYWSTPLAPQCTVGNPCDPTSGDKFETETDLVLPWLQFDRHYHSQSSTAGGAFGAGWTHSHNIRLTLGVDSTRYPRDETLRVGLIDSDGSQIAFEPIHDGYEANNGSGDRAALHGGQWTVYRGAEVMGFDGRGQLQDRAFEDGTWLHYGYDRRGRLLEITHSSGRQLQLQYAAQGNTNLVSALVSAGQTLASYGYGTSGQVASVTFADGQQRIYHYENPRFPQHLTGITAEGAVRFSWFAYDEKGRVTCSRHGAACSSDTVGIDGVRLQYTAGGTVVTDALGKQRTYALTPAAGSDMPRKLTGIEDEQGAIARSYLPIAMDFRRRLESETDRRGTTTRHTYADEVDFNAGHVGVHTVTEAYGLPEQRVTVRRTAKASNRVLLEHRGDRETRIIRNARLQPQQIIVKDLLSGQERITTLSYCEAEGPDCPDTGLLRSVDGPLGGLADTTTYAYYTADDAGCSSGGACAFRKGDLRSTTNGLGHAVETLAYDAAGRPLSTRDANNVVTDYRYHARGWPTQVIVRGATTAADRITSIAYWPTGQVKQVIQPDGSAITYEYDAAQRLTDIADTAGNTLHYVLDNAGNRLQEKVLDNAGTLRRTLARVYDTLGQLTALKDAGNHATTYGYDANSNPTLVTDALLRPSTQGFDALNRLARSLQDSGGVAAETLMQYDALDNVTRVTDPKGLHTNYQYNGFGDLLVLSSPDTGSATMTVDAAGNRVTRTDARGVTATYGYDALNRVTSIAYPDPNQDVGVQYDVAPAACAATERFAIGRVGRVVHPGGSTQYCHDRFGQVTRKIQTINNVATTLRYTYDKAGRLASVIYPGGAVADYMRDAQGRVTQVGLKRGTLARQVLVKQVGHAPFGPITGWTYGNERRLNRPHDQDYRVSSVSDASTGGLKLGFGYDAVGALTQLRAGASGSVLANYGYDAMGRLLQAADAAGMPTHTYGWDATGNRSQAGSAAGTLAYHYPATSHRLTSVGGLARSYDAAGNTTQENGLTYAYNSSGRLGQVKQGATSLGIYRYNHRGERVLRQAGGKTTTTLYDESGQWLGEYSASGVPLQQVVWLETYPIAVFSESSAGVPALGYVQPDHLGTPRVIIDAARNVPVWEWVLTGEAFGADAANEDPDGDGIAFGFALRFPGQQATQESGLNYNYQRDYDAGVGRYVQSDPIGLKGGRSTYGYVAGGPLGAIDSLGLQTCLLTTVGPMGIRDHSAIYTARGDGSGGPALYDPAGAYGADNGGGSSGMVTGDAADISRFTKFHDGQKVESSCKSTSRAEEENVMSNAMDLPSAGPFECAIMSSSALSGNPSFPHVEAGTFFPGNLLRQVLRTE
jgi:RHS repeat-associated protein